SLRLPPTSPLLPYTTLFRSLLACCLAVGTAWAGEHLADDSANELKNRGLRTQLLLLRRVGLVLIGIFGAAVVLLQFELVRSVGRSEEHTSELQSRRDIVCRL